MKRFVILFLIAAYLVARKLLLNHLIKKHQENLEKNRSTYFSEYRGNDETRRKAIERWRESGRYRRPRKTIIKSLENAPYDPEYMPQDRTEYPGSVEEIFKGLDDSEISRILDQVLDEKSAEETYERER